MAFQSVVLFSPNASTSISASTTSASAAISALDSTMRLYNAGSAAVFVRWGIGAQTALTTDMCIPAGAVETFNKGNATFIAAITSASTATLYISTGEGA